MGQCVGAGSIGKVQPNACASVCGQESICMLESRGWHGLLLYEKDFDVEA